MESPNAGDSRVYSRSHMNLIQRNIFKWRYFSPHLRINQIILIFYPSGSLLINMFKSPESRVQTEALPPLDASSHQLAVLCLNCLSHLFSWIPLSSTITPSLLSTIFHFAGFGCDTAVTSHGTPPGSNHSFNSSFGIGPSTPQSLGVLAMCCINELLAKNCVPQEFEDFLLQMFQQTFYLLQRVTKETTTNSTGNRLQDLDERYEAFSAILTCVNGVQMY